MRCMIVMDEYINIRPVNIYAHVTDDKYGVILVVIFPDKHIEQWLVSYNGGTMYARKL